MARFEIAMAGDPLIIGNKTDIGARPMRTFHLSTEGARALNAHRSQVAAGRKPTAIEIVVQSSGFIPTNLPAVLSANGRLNLEIYPGRTPLAAADAKSLLAEFRASQPPTFAQRRESPEA